MRPVSTRSIALALPTARVRRWVPPAPGMVPMVISGWPNLAVSAAMIMSHIMAISQPPPRAKPATAAMVGLRHCASRSQPLVMKSLVKTSMKVAVLHLLDVGAGGEGAVAARHHDGADIGIGLEIVQRLLQLGDQLRAEGIQRLRTVEGDETDAVALLDEDGFEACSVIAAGSPR